jgi:nitroreductase
MENFLEVVKTRRSIRKYQDREVSDTTLAGIFEAVRWSPSWANTQCWEIVVVRDPATRQKLQETIGPQNPATKAITAAPVLLALCGRLKESGYYNDAVTTKFGDWFLFDLGIATQTLCLAAHNAGLGTVVVGLFDHDRAGRILNVPEGVELVALIPTGIPAKTGRAPERKAINDFVRDESF